jgi:hypothetical protein
MASDILRLFAKYTNKNDQNVNSKRLRLTTVYFLTLNGYLALFLILTSESSDTDGYPTRGDSCHTTVEPVKYWVISSFFRFFRGFILIINFKCHNLSKRNVKLILKVLSDLEPLRGSSNKKTLYSTRSCVNWAFFGTRQINYYFVNVFYKSLK